MTERAEVLAVNGPTVTVRCSTTETCSSCTSILCAPRSRTYEASIASQAIAASVVPGAMVEVDAPSSGALGKGVLLFGLPPALFAAAYLALGPQASEAARVALGFGGLSLGLLVAVAVSRVWRDPLPTIVQVYRAPELVPFDVPVGS
jgi:positive regulator of sigma E activity